MAAYHNMVVTLWIFQLCNNIQLKYNIGNNKNREHYIISPLTLHNGAFTLCSCNWWAIPLSQEQSQSSEKCEIDNVHLHKGNS